MANKKIAVIGAGPMGLACAYELGKKGYQLDVYEADDRIGGMSASFDFAGLTIERYYHFICSTDTPLFELLTELNLSDQLCWQDTKMGFFYDGKLYKWGDPLHLLTFPKLGLIAKLRYALHIFYTKNISNWEKLDKQDAVSWLKKWLGDKTYHLLWGYLFELKFYQYKDNISAAWIGTRIKRVASSRRNLSTESLGYLQGGSDVLLNALRNHIIKHGNIYLNSKVERVIVTNNKVQGIIINGEQRYYDTVISTIPLPYAVNLVPDLPPSILDKIKAIHNCGVVCVLLKLNHSVTENFWLNVNDAKIEIPGLIEYTNLYKKPEHIVYIPFYMPKTHHKYTQADNLFIDEVFNYLKRINPDFSTDWVLATRVSRYEFAQPICTPNFYQKLPAMQTPIQGLILADTSHYYPEDRSISESVKLGKTLANLSIK